MPIPRKLFQTVPDRTAIDNDYSANIAKLIRQNPGWEHRLFDNADMTAYLRDKLSPDDWRAVQDINPKYGVVLADLWRYAVIYHEGGVYLDIKSTINAPLDEILKPDFRFVISQWRNKFGQLYEGAGLYPEISHVPGGEFQQWFVISEEGHPFLKAVIAQVIANIRNYSPKRFGMGKEGVLRLSGPICYTSTIWPLRQHFPMTALDVVDLGFQYSIYEGTADKDRHARQPSHYSNLREPNVLKDVYVDRGQVITLGIGELLAREVLENTDVVLKLAVLSFVATISFIVVLPILLWGWR
ncbi:glycosyltransferase family 32 protein [Aestuariivirga sp.]|uniref:glycosyltransferase family 32 protein n=1 Tax=Aestuariivirga sp. TaxID=2650926 RepID=UPI003BAD8231